MFKKNNSYIIYFKKLLEITYLQVLESIVYIFIYKKEQTVKSEKFKAQTLKNILVGYNKHTIYIVFIQSLDKVI